MSTGNMHIVQMVQNSCALLLQIRSRVDHGQKKLTVEEDEEGEKDDDDEIQRVLSIDNSKEGKLRFA